MEALFTLNMTSHSLINVLFLHANNVYIGGSDYCLFKLVTTLDKSRFNPDCLAFVGYGDSDKISQV